MPQSDAEGDDGWVDMDWSAIRAFPHVHIMDSSVASLTECAVFAGRAGFSDFGVEQGTDCW